MLMASLIRCCSPSASPPCMHVLTTAPTPPHPQVLLAECKLAIGRRDAAFHQLSQGRHQAEELLGSLAGVRDEQLVVAAAALNASIESAARACVDEASCEAARQVLLRAEAAYGRRVAALAKLEQGLKQLAASSSQQLLRSGVPRLNQAIDEALAAEVAVVVTNDAQSRLERALALATLREASGHAQAAWDRFRQHGEAEALENALPPLASAVAALADTGVDSAVVGAAENERRTVRFASPAQTEALVAERLLADVTRALRRRQDAFQALVSAREAAVLHLPPSAACRTANGSVVRRYVDVTALGAAVAELDSAVEAAKRSYVSKPALREALTVLTHARAAAKEVIHQRALSAGTLSARRPTVLLAGADAPSAASTQSSADPRVDGVVPRQDPFLRSA